MWAACWPTHKNRAARRRRCRKGLMESGQLALTPAHLAIITTGRRIKDPIPSADGRGPSADGRGPNRALFLSLSVSDARRRSHLPLGLVVNVGLDAIAAGVEIAPADDLFFPTNLLLLFTTGLPLGRERVLGRGWCLGGPWVEAGICGGPAFGAPALGPLVDVATNRPLSLSSYGSKKLSIR